MTARNSVTVRYCCACLQIWFPNAHAFRLSTHLIRFRLLTRVSCRHPRIAIFLFSRLEHDGRVKGQYATIWSMSYTTSNIFSSWTTLCPVFTIAVDGQLKILELKKSSFNEWICYVTSKFYVDYSVACEIFSRFLSLRGCLHLYCYFHNVSADISYGLLQVFVELGNLHGTSNYVLYWNPRGRLFWFR